MSKESIKMHVNYWYSFKLICFAICLGIYPSIVVTQYNYVALDYKILVMIVLLLISIILAAHAILRLFLSYMIIERNRIIIKTVTKKIIIPIKNIDNIQKFFSRGRNTSIFGKTTYEIRTISKTYKVTSEQYMKLDKIDNYLKLQKENK